MAQNLLLMNSLENEKSFLHKLIPHKILETIFSQNFVKKSVFWGNCGSELLSKVSE
jgi:hypothetical protein